MSETSAQDPFTPTRPDPTRPDPRETERSHPSSAPLTNVLSVVRFSDLPQFGPAVQRTQFGKNPKRLGRRLHDMLRLDGDCWLWQGHVMKNGYGLMKGSDGRTGSVHRIAYELLVGAVPDGMTLDHLCENKRCANPAHLEPVSRVENIRRYWARRRMEQTS